VLGSPPRQAHPRYDRTVYRALTPEAAVAARGAIGGTAPKNVAKELARWEATLGLARRARRARKR